MDRQEATKLIAEKINAAQALINEAEEISNESGVGFDWDLAYGMGGWYNPKPKDESEWTSSDYYEEDYGWQASSQSC